MKCVMYLVVWHAWFRLACSDKAFYLNRIASRLLWKWYCGKGRTMRSWFCGRYYRSLLYRHMQIRERRQVQVVESMFFKKRSSNVWLLFSQIHSNTPNCPLKSRCMDSPANSLCCSVNCGVAMLGTECRSANPMKCLKQSVCEYPFFFVANM